MKTYIAFLLFLLFLISGKAQKDSKEPIIKEQGTFAIGGTIKESLGSMEEFKKLTKIPIVIYYGDYIPEKEVKNPGKEQWRAALQMARKWTETVNDAGGDVTLVVLPEIGIQGNTHFPMSDLNNQEIASLMYDWLDSKELN